MRIGYAICASFCTIPHSLKVLSELIAERTGDEFVPIISENAARYDTRFGRACDVVGCAEQLCGRAAVLDIVNAEPLGPREPLDVLIICPCTGNTLAKLACGITDTSVTMAAKAHLRSSRPLLIAPATNDAMSANFKNIALLSQKKSVYFLPMHRDDPTGKPYSLVADFRSVGRVLVDVMAGRYKGELII